VLSALGERLTNAEIAARLFVSERTVESHVSALRRKLEASSRLELAQLARAHDRAATGSLPGPLELLLDAGGFVGREAERERLRELWRRALAGQMVVVLVSGEAGIGKSRLVAEFAAEVSASARVLLGSCFEDSDAPYQPFVQAIETDIAGVSDSTLRRWVDSDSSSLGRIVPEIDRRCDRPTAAGETDPLDGQSGATAAVCRYLTRSATDGPVVCVLEDVHWATPTTLATVRLLARSATRAPVLVVLTTRDTPPDVDEGLKVFVSELARIPSVESIPLAGLPEADVATLLDRLGATVDAAAVAADTKGNPLLVREVANSSPGTATSLYALLARRYSLLGDGDLAVVDVAAVIGTEFDADLVARALDLGYADAVVALERVAAAGLVERVPGRIGRFTFVHALFRRVRYDELPDSRRFELHGRVAAVLEELVPQNEQLLPELARHACIAAPVGDAWKAMNYSVAAAAVVERSLALEEAAGHYRRAIEMAEMVPRPDPRLHLTLTIRLGELLNGVGDPQARALLLRAAARARSEGDAEALAAVAWAMMRYGGLRAPGGDPEFIAVVADALVAVGPAQTLVRARTLAALSEDVTLVDPGRGLALVHEARAIAEDLGDPMTLGEVLLAYRLSGDVPGTIDGGHPLADRLIELGQQTGHMPFASMGLMHRAWTCRREGALPAADDAMATASAMLGDHPAPIYRTLVLLYRSSKALMAGDLVAAEDAANEVVLLADRGFDPTRWYGPALMAIRAVQGRMPELIPLIEAGIDQPALGTSYRAVLSAAYAHDGRIGDAARILGQLAADDFGGVPRNTLWMTAMVTLAETAEVVGDASAGRAIAVHLTPYSGGIAAIQAAVVAPVDLALAQAAIAAGDHEAAAEAATRAVAASRRRGTTLFLARELVRLAAARRALGAPGAETAGLVEEALGIADRTGAALIRREVERFALLSPVRPASGRRRR